MQKGKNMEKDKAMLIRLDENKKIDLKVSLLRRKISMQSLFESFIDAFIAYDNGQKNPFLDRIIKNALEP